MKKFLIAAFILVTSFSAIAHCCYRYSYRWNGATWVPFAMGTIVGAEIASQNRTVIIEPQPVYAQPMNQPLPPAPVGYHYTSLLDPSCNCYRWALIQN